MIKQWFRRHTLAGYLAPIAVLALVLGWWWVGWPLHPYQLSEAVVLSPEISGIRVVSVSEADGLVAMTLAGTTGEKCSINRDYFVDYWRKGSWYQVLDSRELITGPQPAVGYDRYVTAEGTIEEQFRLSAIKDKCRDRDFPAGRYRLRYYDGLYEFTLGEFFGTPEFDALEQEIK